MPWQTPTLKDVRGLVRDQIRGTLPGADATVPNSVLRVLSDGQGALCHLTLQYIDWLALQLLPDTAEHEWLSRHGDIWLTNADGTTGRKLATLSTGMATFTGVAGTVIPQSTQLIGNANQFGYETTQTIILASPDGTPTPGTIRALDPGVDGNLLAGSTLTMSAPPGGADNTAYVVELDGGTDDETDDELRLRVLERIRQPPMGGDKHDYVQWTLAVPGVTRAWAFPNEMGIGTVTVRFMMDDLRADLDGFPTPGDVTNVAAYLDTVRPVAVKDFFVEAPLRFAIPFNIAGLTPDTPEIRAQIMASIEEMLLALAAPGQTIYNAWKSFAIMNAPGVQSFRLLNTEDDVMPAPGYLATLGDIYYVT
jgi:uncharacterized phage protein gp47/JayE